MNGKDYWIQVFLCFLCAHVVSGVEWEERLVGRRGLCHGFVLGLCTVTAARHHRRSTGVCCVKQCRRPEVQCTLPYSVLRRRTQCTINDVLLSMTTVGMGTRCCYHQQLASDVLLWINTHATPVALVASPHDCGATLMPAASAGRRKPNAFLKFERDELLCVLHLQFSFQTTRALFMGDCSEC